MDRRKVAGLLIGGVVASAVVGVVAGGQISSPAEQAARTRAPDASAIFVPVEQRVLTADVVTRGTGRFGSPQKLSVATSALKASPGFIADIARAGTQLNEGALLLTASGRPLFLLVGDQPLARDLGPGMSGDDVLQLEEALVRLGTSPGEADGFYDDETQAAVTAWYDQNGFSPFTATADQLAAIRTREAELTTARLETLTANDTVGNAAAAVATAQSALTSAQNRTALATRALQRARDLAAGNNEVAVADVGAKQGVVDALRSGRATPAGAAEIAAAQADLDNARANATLIGLTAARAVADAQAILNGAPAKLASAQTAAAAADAAAEADVASKQTALDELELDLEATEGQRAIARADLATAEAIAESTRIAGEQAVSDAQAVLDGAPAGLATARAESDASVGAAAADVTSKQAALTALTNPGAATPADIAAAETDLANARANEAAVRLAGEEAVDQASAEFANAKADVSTQLTALTAARTAQSNAEGSLAERSNAVELAQQEADLARRQAGVQVPADEVVFVATEGVRLSELLVATGDPASGGVMLVTDSDVFVDGSLAVEDAELVTAGMTVSIDETSLGIATEGTVSFVAESPGTNGVDGFHIYFELSVTEAPQSLVGASVRLTIPVQSTGDSVLAVPVSALTMGPDGSSRVQVDSGGGIELVEVTPGLSADGYVEITPATGAVLQAGDLVVIGFDPLVPGSSSAAPSDTSATDTSGG